MPDKALLCGINSYQSVSPLRGCVNDVLNLERLLVERFDFPPDSIRKLLNEKVTRSPLRTGWRWLLKDARPGDRLVFHLSGHGSFVPDDNGDEDDGYDEIQCLFDMDWDEPDSYLRDDELGKWLGEVPEGVLCTVILDLCHSGTGTRIVEWKGSGQRPQLMAVDLATAEKRAATTGTRGLAASAFLDPAQAASVLPRFLPPPPEVRARRTRKKVRPAARAAVEPDRYTLVTACRSDQTAADAWLEGDYHGALTFHLCKALREDATLSATPLVRRLGQQLQAAGFAQIPQREGVDRPGPFLGGPEMVSPPPPPDALPAISGQSLDQRLLGTLARLVQLVERPGFVAPQRAAEPRHLVYVHGISEHLEHYSDPWWDALTPHTTLYGSGRLRDTRHEVLWSNLVNSRALGHDAEAAILRQRIQDVLEDRLRQEAAPARGLARQLPRAAVSERGGGLSLDDFVVYMVNSSVRQQILDRFREVVRPLLAGGARLDIVSHSWGTVVAYEGLCELEGDSALAGRVANLFTVGSALSMPPVRWSLRSANQDGRRPRLVERWVNIDAQGDIVGGALADHFAVDHEELDLVPVGCSRNLGGLGWYDVSCAHASYFRRDNEFVNRLVFARWVNAAT